ncbi:MmgE/PrpD family protein [Mycolicibacterium cosmeticum]|uniref:MmgE/PrpD family protein n=1 Tax=Mycolicibacterium cosmeticum TaxID=258533 RepID=W9AM93_MYCCO|nr:MmgE/PrpD family protein [Mycolicibacterium cosmeticum]TLH69365.1 MmgE/PrpD family protein [Mycolicibacterium cosmeticum]CDO06563.1 MmgE/PrpD family protein [Mycolicibacterium cosmeticum]
MTATGATASLADFVADTTLDDIPEQARTRLAQCLLDFIGVAAAGSRYGESSRAIRTALRSVATGGDTTVVADPDPWPQPYAAMLNGIYAHSLDFDDTHIAGGLHPGAAVIPAVLAVAEESDATGTDLLTSLAVGYEVCCRVGVALGRGAYRRGFHPTAVAGLIGATVGAGRLRGLDAVGVVQAIGLAGSMAAGSMQYLASGAENKRLHPGLAAHNAILATTFAGSGVRGAAAALEGNYGLLHAYTDQPHPDQLTADLGRVWYLEGTGIKPYPACRLTHGAIDAALQVRADLAAKLPPDASVRLTISPTADQLVGGTDPRKRAPENSVDGQFSAVFQAAVALLDGRVDWRSYQRITAPDVRALTARVELSTDATLPEAGAELRVTTDGKIHTARVELPSGEPGSNLSWELVRTKYQGLTRHVFPEPVAETVADLTGCHSARILIRSLRAAIPADPQENS